MKEDAGRHEGRRKDERTEGRKEGRTHENSQHQPPSFLVDLGRSDGRKKEKKKGLYTDDLGRYRYVGI